MVMYKCGLLSFRPRQLAIQIAFFSQPCSETILQPQFCSIGQQRGKFQFCGLHMPRLWKNIANLPAVHRLTYAGIKEITSQIRNNNGTVNVLLHVYYVFPLSSSFKKD